MLGIPFFFLFVRFKLLFLHFFFKAAFRLRVAFLMLLHGIGIFIASFLRFEAIATDGLSNSHFTAWGI
jgi:hypothetical protein